VVVGGRYTLRAAVGHGGMGTVWRATDTQLNRDVAVKEVVPPPGIAPEDRDAMYERMMREARAAAGLSHPGIVQVYDVVTDGDRPWVVMELLDARSLSDMVLEDGPLAPRAVAKVGVALLGALEVAHAAGVLHRDVKPANVLVCNDGRCVLTDFGVARMPTDQQLTTPGMVLGSPHFISPERAMGAAFGPPSDLFSLGVTLYVTVEGQPPFDKGEPIATMHSVVEDPPRPPERAGVLTEVLYGLLEKDPGQRWEIGRARQVLRDLLAGPLTSRTPMFPTDPYAVVPAQRPPWEQQAASNAVTERIGGRALLDPGEPLPVDRTAFEDRRGALPDNRPTVPGGHRADPYRELPDPYHQVPDSYTAAPPHDPDATAVTPAVVAESRGGRAAAAALRTGTQGLAALRRAPRAIQVAAAAGLTAVVLIGLGVVLTLALGGGDGGPSAGGQPPGPAPSAGAVDEPPFEVQEYAGRGMAVNLPAEWRGIDNQELVYIDFVDPADASSQIRLLAEDWSGDAGRLVEVAEGNIRENPNCPSYQRVGELTERELAGLPAMQLEYMCGEGDELRRARWVTVVHDETAYSFRFTARESEFADRETIFDELLRSFEVTD
jgi:serine/threonine protein kinase